MLGAYLGTEAGWGRNPARALQKKQEKEMSKSIKLLATLGLVVLVAACAREQETEEFVVVDPEPISAEPAFTGKFK